jgi:hypothetical protein
MAVAGPPGDIGPQPLDDRQREQLLGALNAWVARHPEPDRPFFGFVGSDVVSPRQLFNAVRVETQVGRQFVHSVELVLTEIPFETYINSIERSGSNRRLRLRGVAQRLRQLFAEEDEEPGPTGPAVAS